MKKGFTLIELLVVVVVIATLMGLVFRLAGVGGNQKNRNITITRMQKLEFALSGYYAAFGTYPPVPLHGTRDIFCDVNDHGIQMSSGGGSQSTRLEWSRVRAACLSQPVACEFPYNSKSQKTDDMVKLMRQRYADLGDKWANFANFDALDSASALSGYARSSGWTDVQVFKFGVMSFLLPRYLFMLAGPKELYDNEGYNAQWRSQNDISQIFRLRDGKRLYPSGKWEDLQRDTNQRESRDLTSADYDKASYRQILVQPSQTVCARWMQALDGIVSGGQTFYGVNTRLDHSEEHGYHYHEGGELGGAPWEMSGIYAPGKASNNSSGSQYILDGMTIRDGWGMDLFYYSPPPYQSYRVWSAGPNQKTIPPWIDFKSLQSAGAEEGSGDKNGMETAARWTADDIVGLSTPAD
ncbi:MAG: prepilin-type N-terminal cleavage/methylation domain-containing protein [Kiritimatiellae bacterium]|nr:prepilin-type N-terminal cleavage/methylation domain-containing protein [Kiritimatiellia bacterium]